MWCCQQPPGAPGQSPEPLLWHAGPGCREVGQRGTGHSAIPKQALGSCQGSQTPGENTRQLSPCREAWGQVPPSLPLSSRKPAVRTGSRCVCWVEGGCGLSTPALPCAAVYISRSWVPVTHQVDSLPCLRPGPPCPPSGQQAACPPQVHPLTVHPPWATGCMPFPGTATAFQKRPPPPPSLLPTRLGVVTFQPRTGMLSSCSEAPVRSWHFGNLARPAPPTSHLAPRHTRVQFADTRM